MKGIKYAIAVFLLVGGLTDHATAAVEQGNTNQKEEAVASTGNETSKPFINGLYSYTDYRFNSTADTNFNRTQGHANQYGIGGNQLSADNKWLTGLYIYRVESKVRSQRLFSPGSINAIDQAVETNTVLANAIRNINNNLALSLGGAYGYSKTNNRLIISPGAINQLTGFAVSRGYNWFSTASLIYRKNLKDFMIKADFRALYSEVHAKNYRYAFAGSQSPIPVTALTNDVLWLIEMLEASYPVDDYVTPFIKGALLQVTHNGFNRALLNTPINGSLPQLSLNKAAYLLGGGVNINYRQWNLRLEQKYYSSGSTYTNNQTMLNLSYQIS